MADLHAFMQSLAAQQFQAQRSAAAPAASPASVPMAMPVAFGDQGQALAYYAAFMMHQQQQQQQRLMEQQQASASPAAAARAAGGTPGGTRGGEAAEQPRGQPSPQTQRGSTGSSDKGGALMLLGPAEPKEDASQGNSSENPAPQACRSGGVAKCAKEKNRAAQRRFRERQKCLITDLKVRADTLQKENEAQRRRIAELEKENSVLKDIMHRGDKAAAAAAAAVASGMAVKGSPQSPHLTRPSDLL